MDEKADSLEQLRADHNALHADFVELKRLAGLRGWLEPEHVAPPEEEPKPE